VSTGQHEGEDLRERPVGELVKQLADQTSTLVRQEIDLAKAELTQKGREAGKGAGLLAGAAVIGLLAAGALTAFLIMLLDGALANWLAALIVGVVFAAIAGALALAGRNRIRRATPPVPEQTVETVKEDVQWAKTRSGSAQT
jgi:MFS family permease